jgi:hypothetical protein
MKSAAIPFITILSLMLLILLETGCGVSRYSTANQNTVSIGADKRANPKEELLGHWESENKAFNYYISSTRVVAIGEVIEDQGITRHQWTYKVLHMDERENSILVQSSFGEPNGFDEGKTTKYIFDGKGGMAVENYTGRKLANSFKCQFKDDRQEP